MLAIKIKFKSTWRSDASDGFMSYWKLFVAELSKCSLEWKFNWNVKNVQHCKWERQYVIKLYIPFIHTFHSHKIAFSCTTIRFHSSLLFVFPEGILFLLFSIFHPELLSVCIYRYINGDDLDVYTCNRYFRFHASVDFNFSIECAQQFYPSILSHSLI